MYILDLNYVTAHILQLNYINANMYDQHFTGGTGGDTLCTLSPLQTLFALTHSLFQDVFGGIP